MNYARYGKIICMGLFFAFAASGFVACAAQGGVALPTNVGLPDRPFPIIIEGLIRWMLYVFGFLAILSFLISGTMYLLAGGDEKSMDKAKKQMNWSIMGVIVGLISLVVIAAIDSLLRGGSP